MASRKDGRRMRNWADRIRVILETHDLTQAELASRLRVSKRSIEVWVSGQGDPLGPAQIVLEQAERGEGPIVEEPVTA